jgi:Flp pilus assembly protein TadD
VASLFSLVSLSLLWQSRGSYWKIFWAACVLVHVAVVVLSGKPLATYISLVGLFLFSLAVAWRAKSFSKWEIAAPLVAIVLLAVGLMVDFPRLTHANTSTTLVLDQRTSMSIAWGSLRQAPFFGTGPQTFANDFQRYRPSSFNDTPAAGIRFNRSGSEWWGQLAQMGAVFVLIQLALAAWFLVSAIKKFNSDWKKRDRGWVWSMTVAMFWLALLVVYFLTPFNFILYFLWWLWLSLNFRLVRPEAFKEKLIKIRVFHFAWFATLGILTLFCILTILSGYFGVRFWLADYNYYRANELIQKQTDISEIETVLSRAISYNASEPGYIITLAQGYATAAQLEASKTTANSVLIKEDVQKAVDALKQAREAGPENAMVYEQTGALYDNLRNLIGNADQLAEGAYAKLTELEPTNPMAFLNLGRAQLVQAQAAAQSTNEDVKKQSAGLLDEAIKNFRISQSLQKGNYLADVNIAYVLKAQGDLAGAKASAEEAQRIKPDDQTIKELLTEIDKASTSKK